MIESRIHLGIMGDAFCHVTYGWYCEEPLAEPTEIEVIELDLGICQKHETEVEL